MDDPPGGGGDALGIALGLARLHAPELVATSAADLPTLVDAPVADSRRTTAFTNRGGGPSRPSVRARLLPGS